MNNEYLISNKITESDITLCLLDMKDKITIDVQNILNTSFSILIVKANTDDPEKDAELLVLVHEKICNVFNIKAILTDDVSAYFNQALFPLINKFERKLRKLLFLMLKLSNDNKLEGNKNKIDELTLERVYGLLFVDLNFCKIVNKITNNNNGFTKEQLIKKIEDIEETNLWSKLNGDDFVPSLKNMFKPDIIDYRNNCMHAKSMDYESYKRAKYVFCKINDELDKGISKIVNDPGEVPENVNENVNNSLKTMAMSLKGLANMMELFNNPEYVNNIMNGLENFCKAIDNYKNFVGGVSSSTDE